MFVAIGRNVIGTQGIDDNHQHVGGSGRRGRQCGNGTPFNEQFPALNSGEDEDPGHDDPRRCFLPETQHIAFMRTKPPDKGDRDSHSEKNASQAIQATREGQPVITGQKGQNENDDSHGGKARRNSGKQAGSQRDKQKENQINEGGNPENFFRDVHGGSPARPVDTLKDQQADAFHETGEKAEPHAKH